MLQYGRGIRPKVLFKRQCGCVLYREIHLLEHHGTVRERVEKFSKLQLNYIRLHTLCIRHMAGRPVENSANSRLVNI